MSGLSCALLTPRPLYLTTPVVSSTLVDFYGGLAVGSDSGAADHDVTLSLARSDLERRSMSRELYHQAEVMQSD